MCFSWSCLVWVKLWDWRSGWGLTVRHFTANSLNVSQKGRNQLTLPLFNTKEQKRKKCSFFPTVYILVFRSPNDLERQAWTERKSKPQSSLIRHTFKIQKLLCLISFIFDVHSFACIILLIIYAIDLNCWISANCQQVQYGYESVRIAIENCIEM